MKGGPEEGIAPFGADVLCSRDASAVREGTRNLEGGEVNDVIGEAGSRVGIADHVGTGKVLAGAIVVATVIEVQLEGLPGLQGQDAVDRPSSAELGPGSGALGRWELVIGHPRKTMAHVKVGVAAFQVHAVAVVGLRGIGLKVRAVTGIVNRMGVIVIDRDSKP